MAGVMVRVKCGCGNIVLPKPEKDRITWSCPKCEDKSYPYPVFFGLLADKLILETELSKAVEASWTSKVNDCVSTSKSRGGSSDVDSF